MTRFILTLLVAISLTACAPVTTTETRAPLPAPLSKPLSPYFVLEASIDGEELSLTPERGVWLLNTEAYELGLAFRSPDTVRLTFLQSGRDDFTIDTTGLAFSLRNNNPQVLRVLWEESVFVLPDGSTSRILRAGTQFTNRNNPQPNSIVPSGGRIDEEIVPVSNVDYTSRTGWFVGRIFFHAIAPRADGRRYLPADNRVTLFLVLEIEAERHELSLTLTNPTPVEFLR